MLLKPDLFRTWIRIAEHRQYTDAILPMHGSGSYDGLFKDPAGYDVSKSALNNAMGVGMYQSKTDHIPIEYNCSGKLINLPSLTEYTSVCGDSNLESIDLNLNIHTAFFVLYIKNLCLRPQKKTRASLFSLGEVGGCHLFTFNKKAVSGVSRKTAFSFSFSVFAIRPYIGVSFFSN